eukprot:TRINITY_DN77623_c0_g1_i1.p1 TRINITY_DN77623_c0_g1~~TRINITY_DN77623_c0_g1_i1.p1  ORF type:complete len:407 (-),score=80.81 TRINITY_DN77623_c0_g1_i1:177-1397(-)
MLAVWTALGLRRMFEAAVFVAGAAFGAAAYAVCGKAAKASDASSASSSELQRARERFERKLAKYQRQAQERVHWAAVDKEVLGLQPRLWMEVLDREHRYASLLYDYWRRWQLSDTGNDFFEWLEHGQGSMVDLPSAPRRLLTEWKVIYLRKEQQPLFRVKIEEETGRFLWEADGTPVTIPISPFKTASGHRTAREKEVIALLAPALQLATRRDDLLVQARAEVERARCRGEEASKERLEAIAAPLVEEGLLCQLRDPHFTERLDASPEMGGHAHLRKMETLPSTLLPDRGWDDFLSAVEHDQGAGMSEPLQLGEARFEGKGMFVLDSFGQFYCGTKIRGVFHHSSFVRGHCVKVAGGIIVKDGWLVELSPHSGHYQPGTEHVDEMIGMWQGRGVDFTNVYVKPFLK